MKKLRFFINFQKEESWLEEMSNKGFIFVHRGVTYKFYIGTPEASNIKIDYRQFKNNKDFLDYCTMFEDSGWKHIDGSKSSGTQYFKQMKANSNDDIFSDKVSKAGRFKRLSNIWATLAVSYVPIFIALATTGAISYKALFVPKAWYYTPGLWSLTGLEFWRKFLFETPFALARGLLWLYFPVCIILYLGYAIKAILLYNKEKVN